MCVCVCVCVNIYLAMRTYTNNFWGVRRKSLSTPAVSGLRHSWASGGTLSEGAQGSSSVWRCHQLFLSPGALQCPRGPVLLVPLFIQLFHVLKDDAVKVLPSICQQIWKTQQWPQDRKRSVFIPIRKEGDPKKCSNYRTIALISHASKVMLKILQARHQQYMNRELPDVQAGFRKGRGTRDQIANIC